MSFEREKKRLGLTTDPREAGYILPSGELLDFSGRKFGSRAYGQRLLDHSEIDKRKFAKLGAMRVHFSHDFSEISINLLTTKRPTKQQWSSLQKMINVGSKTHKGFALFYDIYGEERSYGLRPIVSSGSLQPVKVEHMKQLRWILRAKRR